MSEHARTLTFARCQEQEQTYSEISAQVSSFIMTALYQRTGAIRPIPYTRSALLIDIFRATDGNPDRFHVDKIRHDCNSLKAASEV